MRKPSFDPGLTQTFAGPLRRIINDDGSFNVRREGTSWRDVHPYLHLINMRWPAFLGWVFIAYALVNVIFACIYYAIGVNQLDGANAPTALHRFLNVFFFSSHTLSTVGYGNISPRGIGANTVAAFEALIGVLGLAVATGLLFGRVSRPSAKIGFSESMVIAPYQDGSALEFRVANRRSNSLVELDARLVMMRVQTESGVAKREYDLLRLERPNVIFLPLTWTVVHPIDQDSPLFGKTADDLSRLQVEFLILIKAYDDTFSQTVLARRSYRHDEIVWGRRFAPAFYVDESGDMVVELPKIGALAPETH
jgi:inward rectifier potassium channel